MHCRRQIIFVRQQFSKTDRWRENNHQEYLACARRPQQLPAARAFLCEHGAPAGACNSLRQSPSSRAQEEQDPELRKQLLDSLTAAEERELREKKEKEERERQSHAEQERQHRLVKRLKEATRGTTAGLAVQYALQKGQLDTNPEVKEEKGKILQKAPPPEPDSQKFEAWAKLRFGHLTGF